MNKVVAKAVTQAVAKKITTPAKNDDKDSNTAKAVSTLSTIMPMLLMAGGGIAAILIIRKLVKGVGQTAGEVKDFLIDDEQIIKDAVSDKEILKATISRENAKRMAQGLYDSMVGFGTDEERILSIFSQIKNKADYLAVHKAFGVKPYEEWFSQDDWLSRKMSADRHLAYWLKSEISSNDVCYDLVKKWVTEAGFGF